MHPFNSCPSRKAIHPHRPYFVKLSSITSTLPQHYFLQLRRTLQSSSTIHTRHTAITCSLHYPYCSVCSTCSGACRLFKDRVEFTYNFTSTYRKSVHNACVIKRISSKNAFGFRGALPPHPQPGALPLNPAGGSTPDLRYRLALRTSTRQCLWA